MPQEDIVIPFKAALRLFRRELMFVLVKQHDLLPSEAAERINKAEDGNDLELNEILNQAAACQE